MPVKAQIHQHCLAMIQEKINRLQRQLDDLKAIGANETKSTAGDKHETALAMIQLEQEQVRAQLRQVLDQQAILQRIDPGAETQRVTNGSLVSTDKATFYISIAMGKMVVDDMPVIAVSLSSPLGQAMAGSKPGDSVSVNGISYLIKSVE